MTDSQHNVVVIGGGVVGLGVALEITRRFPHFRLLLLEKEDRVARHQSGHNSGVIHSGVYYKPGSMKARLCVSGAAAMVEFCREHGIAHNVCGKVIVATRADELARLEELRRRGEANGLTGLRLMQLSLLRARINLRKEIAGTSWPSRKTMGCISPSTLTRTVTVL